MSQKNWLKTAVERLLPLSQSNDFKTAIAEWEYTGVDENEEADTVCQLCNHEGLRYEFTVKNKLNSNTLIVGSQCINQFTDELADENLELKDNNGNTLTAERIKKDKKNYIEQKLFTKLDADFRNNDFEKSITDQLHKDMKLTCNQLKCLQRFFGSLTDDEQRIMKNGIGVKMRKHVHQDQWTSLTPREKNFIWKFMSSSQQTKYPLN